MFCTKCGAEIFDPEAVYCSKCGSKIIYHAPDVDSADILESAELKEEDKDRASVADEETSLWSEQKPSSDNLEQTLTGHGSDSYTPQERNLEAGQYPKEKKSRGCCANCGIALLIGLALLFIMVIISIADTDDDEIEEISEEQVFDMDEVATDDQNAGDESDDLIEEIVEEVTEIDYAFDEELSIFESGEYVFVTNEDLDTYGVNMIGAKVYLVTDIDGFTETSIQSTLATGFMMSGFDVGDMFDVYSNFLEEGDIIAVLGTVSEVTDWGITGHSTHLTDCCVFAVGSEAESYMQDTSDESLAEFFVVTEEVANLTSDISEEEYKALCSYLSYEDILRNPDNYDEAYCIVSGTVNQVTEGLLGLYYSIYVVDSSGNKWYCSYSYADGESHVLEGDKITIYGKCNGTTTATTLAGKQVTLPYISAAYID